MRLRRQWQITSDPAAVYHLHSAVNRQRNEWRNEQWNAKLESLDPEV